MLSTEIIPRYFYFLDKSLISPVSLGKLKIIHEENYNLFMFSSVTNTFVLLTFLCVYIVVRI